MPDAIGHRSARIHYEVTGARGPWVVLIHGFGLSSHFWFEHPARLANDPEHPCRVVTLDNRGTGGTDSPSPVYGIGDMADDVFAVLDHAGVDAAYVVGMSLGGMIAQEVALRSPSRVRGLALLATTAGLPHGRPARARDLASLLALAFTPDLRPTAALGRVLLAKRHQPDWERLYAGWPAAMAENPVTAGGVLGQAIAAALHSTGFRLGAIACPTVVIGGEEDVVQPPENSHVLARLIPGAQLENLSEVGHDIPLVDPDVVRRALSRLRGGR